MKFFENKATEESKASFSTMGLSDNILKAIQVQGYDTPSPIQAKAIPVVLEGKDILAAAQTGTGKTAAFTLPLLELLSKGTRAREKQARVLILTPTRELAAQIEESVEIYGQHLSLRSAVVFGGVNINPQKNKLKHGVDVLVATPGRLLDLYEQRCVQFKELEILVLDEADRMLDMGFIHDIRKILNLLPKQRQTLMFSATFSDSIRALAKNIVKNPIEISVSPKNTTAETVKQLIYPVDKSKKSSLLAHLIKDRNWTQVLVFMRTKHSANKLTTFLEKQNIRAVAIHGNKSQGARTKALADFKSGKVNVLVATDIAARGIDIDQLPQVVNYDLPNIPEDYVHRIGRTGRAHASGQAVSLVCLDEFPYLSEIERLIKAIIPREIVDGYEPVHRLPASDLNKRVPKPKQPKQQQRRNSNNRNNNHSKPGQGNRSNKNNNNRWRKRSA
jgi:ATP-dependent RNA helicase RhlE